MTGSKPLVDNNGKSGAKGAQTSTSNLTGEVEREGRVPLEEIGARVVHQFKARETTRTEMVVSP